MRWLRGLAICLTCVAGILLILGPFLPWVRETNVTFGERGPGVEVFRNAYTRSQLAHLFGPDVIWPVAQPVTFLSIGALLVAVAVVLAVRPTRVLGMVAAVLGPFAGAVAAYEWGVLAGPLMVNVGGASGDVTEAIGPGMWMLFLGGSLALAGGLLYLAQSAARSPTDQASRPDLGH